MLGMSSLPMKLLPLKMNGMNLDNVVNYLELDDNFVVNVKEGNNESVEFFFVLCMQLVHTMEKDFTCEWGTKFKSGDVVVVGKYYQKWGSSEGHYVFLISFPIVFLHVAHVKAIKIPYASM